VGFHFLSYIFYPFKLGAKQSLGRNCGSSLPEYLDLAKALSLLLNNGRFHLADNQIYLFQLRNVISILKFYTLSLTFRDQCLLNIWQRAKHGERDFHINIIRPGDIQMNSIRHCCVWKVMHNACLLNIAIILTLFSFDVNWFDVTITALIVILWISVENCGFWNIIRIISHSCIMALHTYVCNLCARMSVFWVLIVNVWV